MGLEVTLTLQVGVITEAVSILVSILTSSPRLSLDHWPSGVTM